MGKDYVRKIITLNDAGQPTHCYQLLSVTNDYSVPGTFTIAVVNVLVNPVKIICQYAM